MILSHKHKYVYVKGQKVAGTSVEMVLSSTIGPDDIATPITPADEFQRLSLGGRPQNYNDSAELEKQYLDLVRQEKFEDALNTRVHSPVVSKFYNHMPLSLIEIRADVPLDQYSIVVTERSPYAKIISLANMVLSYSKHPGEIQNNSLAEIRPIIERLLHTDEFRAVQNIDLYRGGTGSSSLFVIRQENLAQDLAELFDHLNLGSLPDSLPHAKRGTNSDLLDPRTAFTRDELDQINREFSDEFQAFDYEQV